MTIETKLGETFTPFSTRKIEPTSFSIGFSDSFHKHFIKDFSSSHVS